jgi:peptidoglycan/LPS O-acetylase OafA/YrhL
MTLKYRPEIDGLRALAVLSVLIFHAFPLGLSGGLVGVDIFFVISGYLITGILIASPGFSLPILIDFYGRRVRRIFPALILTLIATYTFGWIALYGDEFKELGLHIASGASFLSNITYLRELGYFDADSSLKPLLHLWSLGVEEQYYLIWPLLVYFIVQSKKPKIFLLLLLLGSFFLNLYFSYTNPKIAYFLPLTRFWELFVGAYLAIEEKNDGLATSEKLSLFGLFLVFASMLIIDGEVNFPGWKATIPVLGAYCIIKYSQTCFTQRFLSNKPLVAVGLISYPLYLFHWPLFSFARVTEINPSNLTLLILSLLDIVLAWLTYWLIEKPIRKRGVTVTICLVFVMILIGGIGFNAYIRDGLDFRQVNYVVYKKQLSDALFLGNSKHTRQTTLISNFTPPSASYTEVLSVLVNKLKYSNDFLREQKDKFDEINQDSYMCSREDCQPSVDGKNLIVVIGDSHAANFYSALLLTHKDLSFRQFTDSGCTPITSRYRDATNRCKLLLDEALKFVKSHQVSLVIFAARWPDNFLPVIDDLERFRTHTKMVAIVGPSLIFNKDVEKILLRYDGQEPIYNYINSFIAIEKFTLNNQIKDFASKNNIPFIDKINIFCGDGFCRLTNTGNELFIHDSGHLSSFGALFLGDNLRTQNTIYSLLK